MKPNSPVFIAAGSAACPLCPRCGGALYRVPPRFVDRLFGPGRCRFQCESQECSWIGNLPIEGANSTRFGLLNGLVAGSIVVIVGSVALGLFGLFTIHRERVEVAATHNQSPSTTPSVMIVDEPKKPQAQEAFSVGVGHVGSIDLLTGALKSTNSADAAPELRARPVAVMALARWPESFFNRKTQPSAELSGELLACMKEMKRYPAAQRYNQVYDPKTKQFSFLDTCFGTRQLNFGEAAGHPIGDS